MAEGPFERAYKQGRHGEGRAAAEPAAGAAAGAVRPARSGDHAGGGVVERVRDGGGRVDLRSVETEAHRRAGRRDRRGDPAWTDRPARPSGLQRVRRVGAAEALREPVPVARQRAVQGPGARPAKHHPQHPAAADAEPVCGDQGARGRHDGDPGFERGEHEQECGTVGTQRGSLDLRRPQGPGDDRPAERFVTRHASAEEDRRRYRGGRRQRLLPPPVRGHARRRAEREGVPGVPRLRGGDGRDQRHPRLGAVGGRPPYAGRRRLPAGVVAAVEPAALRFDDAGGSGSGFWDARGPRGGLVAVRVDEPAGGDEGGAAPAGAGGPPDRRGRPGRDGDVGGGSGGGTVRPPRVAGGRSAG